MLSFAGILLGCAQLLQNPPTGSDVPEHRRYPNGYKAKPGVPYWNLSIPQPMSFEEWEEYAQILKLSDAQEQALAIAYDEYRRADWAYRIQGVQAVYDLSAEVAAMGVNQITPEIAARHVKLYDARDQVLPGVLRVERAFFDRLAPSLAESQLESLELVRLMRERSNDMRFDSTFPGYFFDLDKVLIALESEGWDLTPLDREGYRQLVTAWRNAANGLYAQHADQERKALPDSFVLMADATAAYAAGQRELGAELDGKRKRVREPATRTARRIHDLHKSSVAMISNQLSASSGRRLRDEFNRSAYKPFMPDAGDLQPVFEAAEGLSLTPEQRTEVVEVHEAWRVTDEAALARMLDDYLDWNEKTCTDKGYAKADYAEYAKSMATAFESRVTAAEVFIAQIQETLTKSQQRTVSKAIEKWRKNLAAFREQQEQVRSKHHGWPAPYQ